MAALTPDQLVERVLENLGRVSGDLQLTPDMIKRRADDEYRRLRTRLSADFPTIYEKVSPTYVLTAGQSTIAKPTDCASVRVLEKQAGSNWYPMDMAPSLNRDQFGGNCFYEMGGTIHLTPPETAPGNYRIFYTATPTAIISTYDVPDGLEGILIEEVSAWGRQRHNEMEHYSLHKAEAKRIWDDAWMAIYKSTKPGSHSRSGLQITRV